LQKTLQEIFSSQGYEVEAAFDEDQVLEMLRLEPFSAVVLDLPQPIDSTFELCKEIVRLAPGSPLLILSASSHVVDKVLLLEMGADDYVTVPFSPRELVARLRALMRRAVRRTPETFYAYEDVTVDFLTMDVTRGSETVSLTAKEFQTLEFMIKNARRVISRNELLNEVWGFQNYPCTRTVDTHILKLRQKLESDPSDPSHFLTVHGIGYKFIP